MSVQICLVVLFFSGVLGDDDECLWKSCKAGEDRACFKIKNYVGTIWETWQEMRCPNGTLFNKLACQDPDNTAQICIFEEEAMKLITEDGTGTSSDCGRTWTPYKGKCYKRRGNSNKLSYNKCKKACGDWGAEIVEPKAKVDLYFLRSLGHSSTVYWAGLRLNKAETGWKWRSDMTALVDSDDASENLFGSDSDIATEVAALSSPAGKCVVLTGDLTLESDVDCSSQLNCMCQKQPE